MKPSEQSTLDLLRSRRSEGVTTGEAYRYGIGRLSARVKELRDAGYSIETRRVETYNGAKIARYFIEEPRTLTDPIRRHILEQEMELGLL